MQFREHLNQVINSLDREHRIPVSQALSQCDGTPASFEQELQAQVWEHPDLPLEQIMQQVVDQ